MVQGSATQEWGKEEIQELLWSAAPGAGLLRIRHTTKATAYLHGFRRDEQARLQSEVAAKLGMQIKEETMSLAGHNWGKLAVHGGSVAFKVCRRLLLQVHLPGPTHSFPVTPSDHYIPSRPSPSTASRACIHAVAVP